VLAMRNEPSVDFVVVGSGPHKSPIDI